MKIFAFILFLIFNSSMALACSCVNMANISDAQHSKYLKDVEAIFYGEVISLGEERTVEMFRGENFIYSATYQPVKFKVLRAWKGVENSEATVETEGANSSCRFFPEIGSKIMVYAHNNKHLKIPLAINYCSIGRFDDEKMKREYGTGKVFEESQPQPTPHQTHQQTPTSESFWSNLWKRIASFFS